MNTTPSARDLCYYIIPQYAVNWKMIGTLLGLSGETLDIIEYDHMHKATHCCNAMFNKWLQIDMNASWSKLLTVIESLEVCCTSLNSDKGKLLYACNYS